MNGETIQRKVVITNPQGFHLRPASQFAQAAARFQSSVTLAKGDQRINGKSPLELMILGAEQGTELTLEVSGPDAADAADVLERILAASSADEIANGGSPGDKTTA
jgi:phosphotransferase system HPr (HPr) family protein